VKWSLLLLCYLAYPRVEAHASNDSTMSEYCRFAQSVLSLAPMEGFDADFDLGIEQRNGGSLMGYVHDLSRTLTVHYAIN